VNIVWWPIDDISLVGMSAAYMAALKLAGMNVDAGVSAQKEWGLI
jgi:hypothetical protein